jgi:type IV pilus assembly protein PilW
MAMKRNTVLYGCLRSASRGLTLVELMVAVALGLIVTLAITGSVLTMGRQFQIVGSNVAAQGSAQIGLTLLDAAGRSAGAGFYSNGQLICPTWNAWNGTTVVANGAAFMPARIVSGGSNTASDTLVFTGPTAAGALSGVPVLDTTAPGAVIQVGNSGSLATNDLALIGVPGSTQPCTLFQVTPTASPPPCPTNATACVAVSRAVNTSYNPAVGTFGNNPTFGFKTGNATTSPAVVSRVGSTTAGGVRPEAFGVQCNSLVRFNAFSNGSTTPPACTATPLSFGTGVDAIATDVVLMHAQYGISTISTSDVVTSWVDASGATWGAPTAANVARIKAVRVVLVSRSKQPDNTLVTTACTNAGGVANTGPCSFTDAAAPVIDLSATTVAAGKTWQNYRYRVQQAVIPLRNVIWSDS